MDNTVTYLLVAISFWDLIWRGTALWFSANEKRKNWFIALLLVNSIGILPIIYYFFFRNGHINNKNNAIKAAISLVISCALTIFLLQGIVNKFMAQSILNDTAYIETKEYKDQNIKLISPYINERITNPLEIKGEARGNWYFEANFTIYLYDNNKNRLGVGIAQAQSDWMTEDFVPFTAKLEYEKPTTPEGYLILEESNPSGLAEKLKTVEVPVKFY